MPRTLRGSRDLDTVYVPVGMGSGISGLIGVRDLLGLPTEIVGVVAAAAPATALSVAAGHVVPPSGATPSSTASPAGCLTLTRSRVIGAGAARIVNVSEEAAAEAMRVMFAATHNVAEPAGALALAGLLAERQRAAGTRVAVVHTGGNVDAAVLADVLAGRVPHP